MSDMITNDNPRIVALFNTLNRVRDNLEKLVKNRRLLLNGECYLTDKEVSTRLKVSRRTLQDWRTNGLIAYTQVGGKVLYAESDIQAVLEKHRKEAFE